MRYTVLAAALKFSISTVFAGVLDNTAVYNALNNKAYLLDDGTYIIRNVGNNKALTYTKTDVSNLFPSDDDGTPIEIKQHGDGTRWVRLSYGDNKCLSSQWDPLISADHAGDECVVDPIVSESSLEKTKQWWILADPSDESLLSALKDDFDDRKRQIADDGDEDTSDRVYNQPGGDEISAEWKWLESHQKSLDRRLLHRRLAAKLKRSKEQSLGPFWLIPVDHLKDMRTRALAGKEKRTVGGYRSTRLERLVVGDLGQQWTLIKA